MTEVWNKRFAKICGHWHPTMGKFIQKIKMDDAMDRR